MNKHEKIIHCITHPRFYQTVDHIDTDFGHRDPSFRACRYMLMISHAYPPFTRSCLMAAIKRDTGLDVTAEDVVQALDEIGWSGIDKGAWAYETEDDLIRAIEDEINDHINHLSGVD